MNKFILGSILAAISLMAIYGTSASNQVASWVDGENRPATQPNAGQSGNDATVVAVNSTESDLEPIIDVSRRTPLQKAGDIPQRQTVGVPSANNFGPSEQSNDATSDTPGGPIEATNPNPGTQTGGFSGANPANQTTVEGAQTTQTDPPIRALW